MAANASSSRSATRSGFAFRTDTSIERFSLLVLNFIPDRAKAVNPTRFASFDDYWLPFLEKQGPSGDYVAGLSADARERLRQRLRTRLLDRRPDGPIAMDARAWAVRGHVPDR